MDKMLIKIWSDIACPYCYIGKRQLESALQQFGHQDEIELEWHSYELNPDLPRKALDKNIYQFMAEQFSITEEEQKKNMQGLVSLAASVGLQYNFDKLVVTNTNDALRLVKLANVYQLADEAEEALFKAYFTDGKNISDRTVLIDLGKGIGLSENEIANMLDGDTFKNDIKEDIIYSEEKLDLQYIPFYLLNNKDIIQGSLTIEEYVKALDKSYNDWKQNGIASADEKGSRTKGRACSADGMCSL
ncbi:MAG TPA: DsbA family oxidoreductase [Dysgonomonas sp.]|nr:DsbA family oxidoreductase [Dysgonomonas sp.]